MFKRYSKFCFIAFCAGFLGACANTPPVGAASFTIISDQTDKVGKYYTTLGGPVKGKECFSVVLYLIWTGNYPPTQESLLAKVLEENNADALIDTEFKHTVVPLYPFYMSNCISITGTPVKLKGAP